MLELGEEEEGADQEAEGGGQGEGGGEAQEGGQAAQEGCQMEYVMYSYIRAQYYNVKLSLIGLLFALVRLEAVGLALGCRVGAHFSTLRFAASFCFLVSTFFFFSELEHSLSFSISFPPPLRLHLHFLQFTVRQLLFLLSTLTVLRSHTILRRRQSTRHSNSPITIIIFRIACHFQFQIVP